jgi:hypothetical protein
MAIVYVNTKKHLKDILGFSQYIFKPDPNFENYKLITILGEDHVQHYDCNDSTKDTIQVENFILRTPNVKTHIVLETLENIKDIAGSYNMQNIFKTLREADPLKIKNISTAFLDHRYSFLEPNYLYWLHYDMDKIITLPNTLIIEKYITPFYDKISTLSKYYEGEVYLPLVNIMYDNYLPIVDLIFSNLLKAISSIWDVTDPENKKKMLYDIRKAWVKVCDFYVMREIFKLNDINEYIILIGNHHSININEYFKNVLCEPIGRETFFCEIVQTKNLTNATTSTFNCVSLNNTLKVVENAEGKRMPDFDICKKRHLAKMYGEGF